MNESGFKSLFDGSSLTGWSAIPLLTLPVPVTPARQAARSSIRTPASPPATIRGSDPDSGRRAARARAHTAKEITIWSTPGSVTLG